MLRFFNQEFQCYFFVIGIAFSFICISYFLFFDTNHPIIYAQQDNNQNFTKIHTVTIPKGASNPSIDITNLKERSWYLPSKLEINSGDIVKWINDDKESHTVTSGVGSGMQGLLTNKLGTPNGYFDSGLFGSGESWSYNFTNKKGVFSYFCTLHPWMIGAVKVNESPINVLQGEEKDKINTVIPDYPVDAQGNKLSRFPVHTFSNDGKYDIDMGWSPQVLTTNTQSTFLIDFYEMPSNTRAHLLPFDFVIIQNNKTLDETSGMANVGADALKYTFSNPGPVTIRIENVGNTPSYTEFNTLVYSNTNLTSTSNSEKQDSEITSSVGQFSTGLLSPIFLVQLTYAIIFLIPAAVGVIILLYKKGKI
ncbi:MAG: plastocyanin/azurin family copper-binding protein [Nitrososphaeraceae archaeon]|nr:plastocyanin/azurin family copper-binding protein [Nitrososphaeraceae archaeon]